MLISIIRPPSPKNTCTIVADRFGDRLSQKGFERNVNLILAEIHALREQGYCYFQSMLYSGLEVGVASFITHNRKRNFKHIYFQPHELWQMELLLSNDKYYGLVEDAVKRSLRGKRVYSQDKELSVQENIMACMHTMIGRSSRLIALPLQDQLESHTAQVIAYANSIRVPFISLPFV